MISAFLDFSKSRGNDLSTPQPEFGFPGLNPGDRWSLFADFRGNAAHVPVFLALRHHIPDDGGNDLFVHRLTADRSPALAIKVSK
jgi:hypothetical protein